MSNLKRAILIRCDGGSNVGMGHVMRMLYLAEELKKLEIISTFCGEYDSSVLALIKDAGYAVFSTRAKDKLDIFDLVRIVSPMITIFDVRDNTPPEILQRLRSFGIKTITYDDISERCFVADLAIFHPIPQAKKILEKKFVGETIMGVEWVLVDPSLSSRIDGFNNQHSGKKIFLSLGGADPLQLTLDLAKVICNSGFELVVGLGRANLNYESVKSELLKLGICIAQDHFVEILKCDLAVIAFGTIAWEVGVLKKPSILLCATNDHFQSAEIFIQNGVSVRHLLQPEVEREVLEDLDEYSKGGLFFARNFPFDGMAAKRLAKKIASL